MAHRRNNCQNLSTTISLKEQTLSLVEDYRFENRKDNRSAAIEELVLYGLKYKQLVEKKKRERMLG
jgi:metal-responsive CopG/Arc/MetJ family transcriptional regulator